MNNDDDLLNTNRFIADVDIDLNSSELHLDTEASYKQFLKEKMQIDIDENIETDLVDLDGEYYDEVDKIDDKTIEKYEKITFNQITTTVFSIDSRMRSVSLHPNSYNF